MPPEWSQVAMNAVPGVVAAVLSAALTGRWALARFRSERWWEKKVMAYTEIVRALVLMKRYVDAWIENDEMPRVSSEDLNSAMLKDWQTGDRAVEEAIIIGSFIISPKASRVLATLKEAKMTADHHDARSLAEHEARALEVAIPAFVEAARRDLAVK